MGNRYMPAATITAPGATIATGAASASVAIPNASSGQKPLYIRVVATVAAYVRLGKTTATAVAGDALVQPGDGLILSTNGLDTIAAIQVAAAGVVQVSPLEHM